MTTSTAIITGMNGTVAPVLARRLEREGIRVIPWNRDEVPTDDAERAEQFISENRADWFFHIAVGSPDWAANIASICRERSTRFLFTGSVSVFADETKGPRGIDMPPDATDDYGRYKRECEERIRVANPDAIIARLGWQIGDRAESNNMIDFIEKQVAEHGHVGTNANWCPSCAFLEDSADALYRLICDGIPGTYQLEGNPGLTFFEIVSGLKALHGAPWKIIREDGLDLDHRMKDDRIHVQPITARLSSPGTGDATSE